MLTDVAIKKAKYSGKPSGLPDRLFDEKGLYLEISASGGKWWRLKYRFEGREKRISLGVYPDVSLRIARDRRDESRKLLASGVDPSSNRKAAKTAGDLSSRGSFEVVAREWFAKMQPEWVESHAKKIIARLENNVFPWLGKRPIAELTPVEVLSTLTRISDRGPSGATLSQARTRASTLPTISPAGTPRATARAKTVSSVGCRRPRSSIEI